MAPNALQRYLLVYQRQRRPPSTPKESSDTCMPSAPSEPPTVSIDDLDPTPKSDSITELCDLWDEALIQYRDITGLDLRDQDSYLHKRFTACSSPQAVIAVLDNMDREFKNYRRPSSGGIWTKIRSTLRPIVHVALIVLDAAGEAAAATAIPGGKALFVALAVLLKATQGMSERFDAVAEILEKFSYHVARLEIHMRAQLSESTRGMIIEILAHMLRSFAAITHMMSQNRLSHFWTALSGNGDDMANLMRRAEMLMVEEDRRTTAEALSAVRIISVKLDDAFESLGAVASDVQEMSSKLNSSGVLDLANLFEEWTTQDRNDMDHLRANTSHIPRLISMMETTIHVVQRIESRVIVAEERARKVIELTSRVLTPRLESASLFDLLTGLVSCFGSLSTQEQHLLKGGLATILAIAATSVSGSDINNQSELLVTSVLHPDTVLAAFLPMAFVYVGVFLLWKWFDSRPKSRVHRNPGYADVETIIVVDVFGLSLVLELDKCQSWEDIHTVLLRHFAGTIGIDYVESRAYQISDSESLIKPDNWAQTVRANLKVEMSIMIPQSSLSIQCPWCNSPSPQAGKNMRIECATCHRLYWTSQDSGSAQTVMLDPHIDQLSYEDTSPALEQIGQTQEQKVELSEDKRPALTEFRLITIMQTLTYENVHTDISPPDNNQGTVLGIEQLDHKSGHHPQEPQAVQHSDGHPDIANVVESFKLSPVAGNVYDRHSRVSLFDEAARRRRGIMPPTFTLAPELEPSAHHGKQVAPGKPATQPTRLMLILQLPRPFPPMCISPAGTDMHVTIHDVWAAAQRFRRMVATRDDLDTLSEAERKLVRSTYVQRVKSNQTPELDALRREDFLCGAPITGFVAVGDISGRATITFALSKAP